MNDDKRRGFEVGLLGLGMLKLANPSYTKAQAGYVDKAPGGKTCSGCQHFHGRSCSIVDGSISPGGWCKHWTKASKAPGYGTTLLRGHKHGHGKRMGTTEKPEPKNGVSEVSGAWSTGDHRGIGPASRGNGTQSQ
jgi:hypothetical protein